VATFLRGKSGAALRPIFDTIPDVGTIFMSAEGLTGHLPEAEAQPDRLQMFRDVLAPFDVTLVLMLRDPTKWLRSYHQQKVCNPPNDPPEFLFATSAS
jgi:hypothetical protein